MASHIVAKRSTKESAEREMVRCKKTVPKGMYIVRKYGEQWGVFSTDKKKTARKKNDRHKK